ncbi:hypothetical protein AMTRI_Chr03g146590 [Amborella trichopoda]
MTKVRCGYIARRPRKKIRLFASTFRGKRVTFRHLWIVRINSANHESGVFYHRLIYNVYMRQLFLNCKIPA